MYAVQCIMYTIASTAYTVNSIHKRTNSDDDQREIGDWPPAPQPRAGP